jgi:hypothetical protein
MSPAALRLNSILLPLTFAAVACQDPTVPQTDAASPLYDVSTEACDIDSDWCGVTDVAGSYRLMLNGFDSDALTLTGVNRSGAAVSAQLTMATAFKPGLPPSPIFPTDPTLPPSPILPPNPIIPTDPLIIAALAQYNDAVSIGLGEGPLVYSAISSLAAAGAPVRVWIDQRTGAVRAFRPIN